MDNVDAVVVGAGVVGLAVARALARTGLEVVILESENAFGTGVSARNSEVIHAGLYYPTHSHKARLCVQGREQLYAFCETYGVHHRRCGKLLVATSEAERSKLDDIARQAFLNGVTDLQPLEAAQARQLEPEVSCVAALWSPSTGIVDSHALMTALLGDAQAHGAQLALLTRVVQARPSSSGWILSTQGTEAFDIATRLWVNCAGLHAVELARSTQGMAATGLPNAHYAKGNYFALRQRSPFQRLVYPMPTDGGLGIHLTLDLGGQARFGPDTQWLPEGTHPSSIDYAVSGDRQAAFYADIRRYWPGLPDDALAPAYTGVRPKLGPPGTSHDFMLLGPQDHGLAGCVHLLGIESPGLTSCLALADEVVRMLKPPPSLKSRALVPQEHGMTSEELLTQFGPRESMEYDVVVVGSGPAGLSTAIRLKQIDPGLSVVVLEKGSEPGAHILSGAVMDPRALQELFPDWKERGAPLNQPVTSDDVLVLDAKGARRTPDALVPDCLHNEGCYVIRLGALTKWLAEQAEALGVEIFPGFAAAEVLFNEAGAVRGVATGNMGVGKDGQPHEGFQLGMELLGKYTVLAEGARGHLGKRVIAHYHLDEGRDPQSYALGIKELWDIDPAKAQPGKVVHTAGWPMDENTYGGGFLYHLEGHQVTLGFVTGLDYQNPWLSPFEEMQRWKTHPAIRAVLEGGKRVGYGARAITAGGILSLPKLAFPGGVLVGCDAGTLNASRIKGSHAAIKSGMLAAQALAQSLQGGRQHDEVSAYEESFRSSWLFEELDRSRNFKQWFKKGNTVGMVMTGIEQWLLPKLGFKSPPWTIHRHAPDHERMHAASQVPRIDYPKPDGVITFDRLSSVFVSSTNHEENQPAHLTLKNAQVPVAVNLERYAGPEGRYCPAGVYEFVQSQGTDQLVINAQNCVHCKTCDIKDPTQNIVWVTPEGGGGPNYAGM